MAFITEKRHPQLWKPDAAIEDMLDYYVKDLCTFAGLDPAAPRMCNDPACKGKHNTGNWIKATLLSLLTSRASLEYERMKKELIGHAEKDGTQTPVEDPVGRL